jgi:hypothetical protein
MQNPKIKEAIAALTKADLDWLERNFTNNVDQVFTFTAFDTNETVHVNVSKLSRALHENDVPKARFGMMVLYEELHQMILKQQGIERDHLDSIPLDDVAFEPAIVVEDKNNTHIIVDGNHKIVKAYEIGLRRRPAFFVPRESLTPFLYEIPESVSRVLQICTANNVQFGAEFIKALSA